MNPENYKLIPMSEITEDARKIAVAWLACDDKDWIGQKHKLASDIMNYAKEQCQKQLRKELYNDLGEWTKKIFPDADSVAHLFKLKDETDEAIKTPNDIMEYADCLMAIFGASYKAGFTYDELMSACKDKLAIIKLVNG